MIQIQCRTLTNITGSATAISPDEPGYLIVSFPGRKFVNMQDKAELHILLFGLKLGPDGTYLVLDTDYVNYSSVYSCVNVGAFSLEYAWILGREQVMPQEYLVTNPVKTRSFQFKLISFLNHRTSPFLNTPSTALTSANSN